MSGMSRYTKFANPRLFGLNGKYHGCSMNAFLQAVYHISAIRRPILFMYRHGTPIDPLSKLIKMADSGAIAHTDYSTRPPQFDPSSVYEREFAGFDAKDSILNVYGKYFLGGVPDKINKIVDSILIEHKNIDQNVLQKASIVSALNKERDAAVIIIGRDFSMNKLVKRYIEPVCVPRKIGPFALQSFICSRNSIDNMRILEKYDSNDPNVAKLNPEFIKTPKNAHYYAYARVSGDWVKFDDAAVNYAPNSHIRRILTRGFNVTPCNTIEALFYINTESKRVKSARKIYMPLSPRAFVAYGSVY